tara:strand:- start:106 stop:408 length:303 start_codon:yes stop_codon:yes gene_type:complete
MNKYFKLYAGIIGSSAFTGAAFETIKEVKNIQNQINNTTNISEIDSHQNKHLYEKSMDYTKQLFKKTLYGTTIGAINGITFPYSFPLMIYIYNQNKTDDN